MPSEGTQTTEDKAKEKVAVLQQALTELAILEQQAKSIQLRIAKILDQEKIVGVLNKIINNN